MVSHNLLSKIRAVLRIPRTIYLYKNWYILIFGEVCNKEMRELKLRNGMRFVTKSSQDRFAIEGMFYRKAWTKFYKIKNDDTVIDIGAFIGDFATFAASSAKNVKVFAYEPSRKSFEYLVKNTKLNNLDSNIIPFNLAVTNIKKKIKIYLNPDCESAGDSMYLSSSLPYDLVKSTTLKDIFEFNKIKYCNFLKINCEGAEFDILLSTPKKIFKKIGYIAVEYHWIGGKTKRDYDAIIQTLRNNNFKIEHEFTKEDGGYIFAGADN